MASLRYKIGFSYFIIVLVGLITSAFAVYSFSRLKNTFELMLSQNYENIFAAQNMFKALERQENAQLSMLVSDIDLAYVQFQTNRVGFLGWLEKAKRQEQREPVKTTLERITKNYNRYISLTDSLYKVLQQRGRGKVAAELKFNIIKQIADTLKEDCFRYLEHNQDAATLTQEKMNKISSDSTLTVITISLISVLLSFFLSASFIRTILKPAEKLTRSVRNISRGQLNQKIDINTDDEIGVLSREFNKMTERLRAYEQTNIHKLMVEKKKSETIVESIADPVIVTDEEGKIILMNEAAIKVFDLRTKDWQGKTLEEVIDDKSMLEFLQPEAIARFEKEHRDLVFEVKKSNGQLYFRPRQTKILDENGNQQGIITLLQDVTRFKNLDIMKSEFIATVSHELRTPLTSLTMGIDILSQEVVGTLNKKQKELLTTIKDDSERLRKLVKELLNLSRLESGKYEMKKEYTDIRNIVADAIKPMRLPFEEKQISLEIDVQEGLPAIFVDSHQLVWVLSNLLNNALRHTDPGGRVHLEVARTNNEILLKVSDTGHGISSEHLEVIFEKFVQIKNSTETTPGSVGLGLAIAREVVEAHGGRIWVESQVGVGSTFYFTIPIEQK